MVQMGVPPMYEEYEELTEIIAAIEKLLGVI